ncbi:hypothetical protein [Qipengyuania nanhaisediminis]|uniref:Predicted 3'-5' exonuclease related to the exonuclease domain of PolB n=1 Tax=Qipengyuania nanhaisediminis TaxID=604088 RepID=A0A1I5ME49_9SPHN|nr:hypothetical protein [Qipengyuania nanhaisediminis]SFP07800.1 Predicted 3'-5' exonuclease related to the exonuclease domain of PolB [Qipengyuania nanhaisediminis]
MHIEKECFEQALEREARKFLELDAEGRRVRRGLQRIIVADFEYRWDRSRYEGYCVAEGESAEPKIRWPFHRIAAASWMQLRFDSGEEVPTVESVIVLTGEEASEQEMVTQFFEALRQAPNAQLVTWGGEVKDLAVLRRCAGEFGLVLPPHLLDGSPHARERIDLCRAVTVQAKAPHLPEYAAATSIPAKPSPSKQIGQLVEKGDWPKVREQVLADVITTSVIALRHLASHGEIAIDAEASTIAIGEAALSAVPESSFLRATYRPWARDRQRAAGLRGVVYRTP